MPIYIYIYIYIYPCACSYNGQEPPHTPRRLPDTKCPGNVPSHFGPALNAHPRAFVFMSTSLAHNYKDLLLSGPAVTARQARSS